MAWRGSGAVAIAVHMAPLSCTMTNESACGPVAVLVFKTSERGDEPRWWVRLPRALATFNSQSTHNQHRNHLHTLHLSFKQHKCAHFNTKHGILRTNVNRLILRKGEIDVTICQSDVHTRTNMVTKSP
jgi:hypothetical protein